MNWNDPEFVKAWLAERPDSIFACTNRWKPDSRAKRTRSACLKELTVQGGLLVCPVHGTEIVEVVE